MAEQIARAYRGPFPVIAVIEADLDAAMQAHRQRNMAFCATARRAGAPLR
jgi:hypothetical protein